MITVAEPQVHASGQTQPEWKSHRLGDIATFSKGRGLPKAHLTDDGDYACVHYGDLFRNYGAVIDATLTRCDVFQSAFFSNRNDVLMPTSDVTPSGLATASCITKEGVVIGGDVLVIRPYPEFIHGPFLARLIRLMRMDILRLVKGSTVYHLYGKDMAGLYVTLPDVTEQRRTAEILEDVDRSFESLEQLIAKKRNVMRGTMQTLLSGSRRLPGFSDDWNSLPLSTLGEFSKGSGIKKDEVREEGYACVRYGEIYTRYDNVISHFYSFIDANSTRSAKRICKGDILFACSGETKAEIGKAAVVLSDLEVYAGGDLIILSPISGDPTFLGYALNSESVNQQKARLGRGDAVVHISVKDLCTVSVKLPDEVEQRAIAVVLSDMDAEIEALEKRLAKTRNLKQGMAQELLSGRTRLV